jgi:hypothetical protein
MASNMLLVLTSDYRDMLIQIGQEAHLIELAPSYVASP